MWKTKKNDPMVTSKYDSAGKARKLVQTSHRAWYMTALGNVIVVLIHGILDASTLFTQFDTAMNAAMVLIWVVVAGICFAENFVPLLASSYFHQCFTLQYRGAKYKVLFVLSVTVTILLLSVLTYMRWATRNASIDMSLSSLGGSAAAYAPKQEDSGVRDSLAVVLSTVPWVTSFNTFMMGYFTNNPLENRRHALQNTILKSKERLADVRAAIREVELHDLSAMEELVYLNYLAAIAELEQIGAGWHELALRKLKKKNGTPEAISQLSGEAEATSLDSLPKPALHLPAAEAKSLPDAE